MRFPSSYRAATGGTPIARRVAAAFLVVGLAGAGLTGCSLARNVAESATGGKVDVGGKSVPTSFPKADVPLVDGDVLYGAALSTTDGQGWNVTLAVSGVDAFDGISAQLTGAGFTAGITGEDSRGASGTFTKAPYTVIVLVTQGDAKAGWSANYTVTRAAASETPAPSGSPSASAG